MKKGTISRSTEEPTAGFLLRREAYNIFMSYIPADSIHTVFVPDEGEINGEDIPGHTEYEFTYYSNSVSLKTYESLVNKMILMLYTNEDELGMINGVIKDGPNETYSKYREYVNLAKSVALENYVLLGLVKDEE